MPHHHKLRNIKTTSKNTPTCVTKISTLIYLPNKLIRNLPFFPCIELRPLIGLSS